MSRPPAMLPNLLIIGAQKCGTSSMHRYLSLHPEIAMSKPKELDFFVDAVGGDGRRLGNWHRGVDWYRSHFPDGAPVRGESSPEYTSYPRLRGVPERAAGLLGEAKLVYMVRDPIERMLSQYLHRRAKGREVRSLDEALTDTEHEAGVDYLPRSRYFMQLEQWLDHFPADRVEVVALEDLRDDREATLRRTFRFLEVDDSVNVEANPEVLQRSAGKRRPTGLARRLEPSLSRATGSFPPAARRRLGRGFRAVLGRKLERPALSAERRAGLESALHDDVAELRRLTGQRFAAWSM